MEKDFRTMTMPELKAHAHEQAIAFNTAADNADLATCKSIEKDLDQVIGRHNDMAKEAFLVACRSSEDPMLTAVTKLVYPTIKAKITDNKDKDTQTCEIVDTEKQVDLAQLHKFCKSATCGGIGKDVGWVYQVEQLNYLLTVRVATNVGVTNLKEIADTYAMDKISKSISLGKNPTSNTQLLKTLQGIITSMIGEEYKATSHDVAFLNEVYSKKSRDKLTITTANHKQFRGYIAEICHRIVNGLDYKVAYKKEKKA